VEWILEKNGIMLYDVFRRPSYWAVYSEEHRDYPIIRFLKGQRSIEIRFPKGRPGKLLVRETLTDSHAYGEFVEENLTSWWVLLPLVPLAFIRQFLP
jgi:hypothetical protein